MKLIKKQNNKKGFTLIELVIVIAILAILALILIPAMSGYISSADKSKDQADARSIYTAASVVVAEQETITNSAISSGKVHEETLIKANMEDTDATVTINVKDGVVESIDYKTSKGKEINFDGKKFK